MNERLFVHLEGDRSCGPESNVPAGTMRHVPVHPALHHYVSQVLVYRESFPVGEEVLERVLPDGALRLAFNLGDAPSADGTAGQQIEVIGAFREPALVRLSGRMHSVSVVIRPGAAAAVLGIPAGEVASSALSLDHLWPKDGQRLLQRMIEAPDDRTRAMLLQEALALRLRRCDAVAHAGAMRAVELLARSGGACSLREIAEAVGVGERRLQQIFREHVGLSPRTWGRLARLHACLRALRLSHSPPAWAEVAVQAGYYDQSHLVNEFRALCGLTPTQFFGRIAISGSSKTLR